MDQQETLFRRFVSRPVSLGLIFPPITLIGGPQPVQLGSTEVPPRFILEPLFGGFLDSEYRHDVSAGVGNGEIAELDEELGV